MKISAIIITKNEEANIEACLKTLKDWVNEIIIIDSNSYDQTLTKAKKFTTKIFQIQTDSFAERRKLGKNKASGDWLFYVDADERVSGKLKKEIMEKIAKPSDYAAFMIPRLNIFFGQQMKYGNWYPDYQTRLFKKEKLKGFSGKIHESPIIEGKIGKLKNYFIHLSHLSVESGFGKSVKWTNMEANLLFHAKHKPIKFYHLLKVFLAEFFERIFVKQGIRDGRVGWLEGIIQAFNKFLVYAQLWEKQQNFYR